MSKPAIARRGNASLGGRYFRLDPTSVNYGFNAKVTDIATVGGKVIQVFGTSITDLTVEGTFGAGGWQEQERFLEWMKRIGDRQLIRTHKANAEQHDPVRFRYPEMGWEFFVYLKAYRSPDGARSVTHAPDIVAPRWTLTLHVVADNSGLKKVAQDKYLDRIPLGMGWRQNKYNGPMGALELDDTIDGMSPQEYLQQQYGTSGVPQGNNEGQGFPPASDSTTDGNDSGAGSGTIPTGGLKQTARNIMLGVGFAADQWPALDALVTAESSWRPTAQNPTSTAYGLFQFLDSTWATVGGTKTSDPVLQIQYGLKYIRQRYGTPKAAWAFHQQNNYY